MLINDGVGNNISKKLNRLKNKTTHIITFNLIVNKYMEHDSFFVIIYLSGTFYGTYLWLTSFKPFLKVPTNKY